MWKSADFKEVKVTDRYYDEALHIDISNMLKLDPDRLVAGFRETAGYIAGDDAKTIESFMKGKSRYGGGWEDGMIGGHTLGHYLTALAQAEANPAVIGDELNRVKERLDYVLNALKECQDKTIGTGYEGYIFGANLPTGEFKANPAQQFDNVEKGFDDPFKMAWVPWYTMHKILTGLNASFKLAGKKTALEVANNLGIWIAKRTEGWSKETRETVLGIEYGGMNDCLYELYQINRTLKEENSSLCHKEFERFAAAAHAFDEDALFEKVAEGKKDIMDNVHANTTIPKFIGALARYETFRNEEKYLEYAEKFWEMVIDKHTYVTGGNSEDEHFGKDCILDAERTSVNNETCNTYNMLKFSRRLFAVTGNRKYLDYSARTLVNAIMASQNHETGFTTYFQPMATGFHKVFNTLDGNFWCCTGTGYENFTKLQSGIYFRSQGKLLVALYLASGYTTDNYTLEQECDFTRSGKVKLSIKPSEGSAIDSELWLRIPTWAKDIPTIMINGNVTEPVQKDGFLVISQEKIAEGAEIELDFELGITCENLPDGPNTYAFMYGPYVLSARLGTQKIMVRPHGISVVAAAGRSVDSDELRITAEKSVDDFIKNIDKYLVKRAGEMEFDLSGVDKPLVFTTHYNQYVESYGIYWKFGA